MTVIRPEAVRRSSRRAGLWENPSVTRVAAIDCGTNSIRLLVADAETRPDGASALVDLLTGKFEPEEFKDEYREQLMGMIQAKLDGKEVVLGTGYRQPIEFMTAEDKPVEVLHLTGALVDAQGRVVRAGAEGIVLRDTPFLAQAFAVTRGFDDEEIARVLVDQRRHDLPGAPLAIDAALDSLLAQLSR